MSTNQTHLFVAGGRGSSNPKNKLYIYNIANDIWTQGSDMLEGVGHSNCVYSTYYDNSSPAIYLFGGGGTENFVGEAYPEDYIQKYDILTDTWTTLSTRLTMPASDSASIMVDKYVYIIGGTSKTSGDSYSFIDIFNCETETLVNDENNDNQYGGMNYADDDYDMAIIIQDNDSTILYSVGGYNAGRSILKGVVKYGDDSNNTSLSTEIIIIIVLSCVLLVILMCIVVYCRMVKKKDNTNGIKYQNMTDQQ